MENTILTPTVVVEDTQAVDTEIVADVKRFAVVEDGKVTNVIVADADFAAFYTNHPDMPGACHEYIEQHEDDTKVARIGDLHIGGKFVSSDQAMDLGLIPDTRPKQEPATQDTSSMATAEQPVSTSIPPIEPVKAN